MSVGTIHKTVSCEGGGGGGGGGGLEIDKIDKIFKLKLEQ